HPFRVIIDHAFSEQAIEALVDVVRQMAVSGRKRLYVMRSGRVPVDEIRATGRALAGTFDHYVCTNLARLPGPEPQTVPGLLREGSLAGGAAAGAIACSAGEEDALRHILSEARAGDLVVVNTAEVDRAVAIIESFDAGREPPGPPRAA